LILAGLIQRKFRLDGRAVSYYHRARTHLALDKDAPDVGPVETMATPV